MQAGLTSSARRKNALGSFTVANSADLSGRSVLLVDDVFTTGTTAMACARLLKQAGAAKVEFLALARVDRRVPAAFPRAGEAPSIRDMELDGAGFGATRESKPALENREFRWE